MLGFWAALAPIAIVAALGIALFARDASFTWNGEPVSRSEFLSRLPVSVLGLSLLAAYFGAIALGIWRERSWVRPAAVAFWIAVSVLLLGTAVASQTGIVEALVWSAVYVGFASWYFYRKRNVSEYYAALQAREQGTSTADSANPQAAV